MIRWLLMRQCCHFVRTDLCSTQLHLSDKVKNHQYKGLKQNVVILGHQRPHPAETLKTGTMDSLDNSLSTRLLVAGHMGEAQGRTARYITSWNTHQLFHGKYQGSGLWGFFSPLLLYNDLYTIHTHTHPCMNLPETKLWSSLPMNLAFFLPRHPEVPRVVLVLTGVSSKLSFVLSEHCEEGIRKASIWYYANYIF